MSETSLATYLASDAVKKNIESVIGKNINQFITSVVSLVGANKNLAECDRQSLLTACITAASLNLPINQNLGFAYIIPYKNRATGITEAQFQIGYKGFIQLAQRSNEIKKINVSDVREGEYLGINRLTGDINLSWIDDRDKLPIIGYIGYFETITGFEKSLYYSVNEIERHGKKFSQTYKKGFGIWKDDFDAMAKKTVIKLLLSRYAPMNSQLSEGIVKDQAIIKDNIEYIDNQPINPTEVAEEKEIERLKKHIQDSQSVDQLIIAEQAVLDSKDSDLIGKYELKLNKLYTQDKFNKK